MPAPKLVFDAEPRLSRARMVIAFSGWMDGGDVSTGTVKLLCEHLKAEPFARIEPEGFYIYNFPGPMEVSALFRPHVRIESGLLKEMEFPTNEFYCDQASNLVFFVGKEPNLNWEQFGECIFELAQRVNITTILFVGSFGGAVPHTREPRLYASVSEPQLLGMFARYNVRPSDYEGPGSFVSYLMSQAHRQGVQMASVAAEIPGYLQGTNPRSIEAVTRRLAAILGVPIDMAPLRGASDEWEAKVSEAVTNDAELAEQIRKLEDQYDQELIEGQSE